MLDQALVSGQSFALVVLVARESSAQEFGLFTLAYAVLVTAQAAIFSLVVEPRLLATASNTREERENGTLEVIAIALLLSYGFSFVSSLILIQSGPISNSFIAVSLICFPALVAYDSLRALWHANEASHKALVCDLLWCGVWLVLMLLPVQQGIANSWLLAGAVTFVFATIFNRRYRVSAAELGKQLRFSRKYSRALVAEAAGIQTGIQILGAGTAAVATLAVAGGIRGAQALFGPLGILLTGYRLLVYPRVLQGRLTARDKLKAGNHNALVFFALAASLSLLGMALPVQFQEVLFGEASSYVFASLLWVGLNRSFGAAATIISYSLKAVGDVVFASWARALSEVMASLATVAALALGWGSYSLCLYAAGGLASCVAVLSRSVKLSRPRAVHDRMNPPNHEGYDTGT